MEGNAEQNYGEIHLVSISITKLERSFLLPKMTTSCDIALLIMQGGREVSQLLSKIYISIYKYFIAY
jgi:hypothetical protein